VPLRRSRSEEFDELVLDAVDELEEHWAAELAGVEFAVEDVPPVERGRSADFQPEMVVDRGIPLGQVLRAARSTSPVVVVYRRPIEARALDRDDRGDLVFTVVAELVAELLGRDIDEIDPPRD
jgi:predicted Zn-dependent protease with MMP-like domain